MPGCGRCRQCRSPHPARWSRGAVCRGRSSGLVHGRRFPWQLGNLGGATCRFRSGGSSPGGYGPPRAAPAAGHWSSGRRRQPRLQRIHNAAGVSARGALIGRRQGSQGLRPRWWRPGASSGRSWQELLGLEGVFEHGARRQLPPGLVQQFVFLAQALAGVSDLQQGLLVVGHRAT